VYSLLVHVFVPFDLDYGSCEVLGATVISSYPRNLHDTPDAGPHSSALGRRVQKLGSRHTIASALFTSSRA
jgi:hypothetical protein